MAAALVAAPATGAAQVVNGSFESGDYTGWELGFTSDAAAVTFANVASGTTINPSDSVFDFFGMSNDVAVTPSLPQTYTSTDGSRLAVVLSLEPHTGRLYQDVMVPVGSPMLAWDMSWVNSHTNFDPTTQYLAVFVRDPNNDAILATLFETMDGIDPLAIPMSPFFGDLGPYQGQLVRIDITTVSQDGFLDYAIDDMHFGGGGGDDCGNGAPDPGEECDDGNREDADGCNAMCGIDSDFDAIVDLDELDDTNPSTPPPDTDGDTVPDYLDEDSDGDTILDFHEAGDPDPFSPPVDTDGDLVPDFRDPDSDGDGVADAVEAGDSNLMTPPVDTDGDFVPDFLDLDSDDDSVPDASDNCRVVANADQRDGNDDGIGDACQGGPMGEPIVFGGGGGCSSSAGGGGLALALLALVWAVRRRRAALLLLLAVGSFALAPGHARAQVTIDEDVSIDRFVPAADRDGILNVEWAGVPGHLEWDLGLVLSGLADPLVARVDGQAQSLIARRYTSVLTGAVGLFGRGQLGLSLPLVMSQSGDPVPGVDSEPVSGGALGDLRIAPKVLLLGLGNVDVSLLGAFTVPSATGESFTGERSVTFAPQLAISGQVGSVRLAANAGYLARDDRRFGESYVGDEVSAAFGVAYRFDTLGLELDASAIIALPATGSDEETDRTYVELLAGGSYAVSDSLSAFAGAGRGLTRGIGSPDWRAVVGVRYSRRGASDAAPRQAPRSLEVVVLLPDEDGHVGSIEVDDGTGTTVLDTPYASTRLGPDDTAARPVQSSADAVPATTRELVAVLPPPDRDLDDIADTDDSCPDRAGPASTDPLRHGCPASVEKVVVLPDANGNVGAIEIDDGTTTTLLDQPYATAEVGVGGGANRVPPAPPEAVTRAIAAALPLPPADSDDDGIADAADVCPERPGQASTDPLRNGCPAASERVVVLPDADGSVGSLEITAGGTTTVLSEAYASADVAAHGQVAAQPPAAAGAVGVAARELAVILPVADEDGDGTGDDADACPDRAGTGSANPLRDGCPGASETVIILPDESGTVGSIEIDDGSGKVVLDKPFATAEVGANGRARAVPYASAELVQKKIAGLARELPRADRDGDGIADIHDACADRPGKISTRPALHGCPTTVETVVLVPDADGHVGSLEIGQGAGAIVLDGAYATAEIGADGEAVTVRMTATEVETAFRETLAARPDYSGARIAIYFTKRAQPTVDVSEQIEDLVADLYGRSGYKIQVIGHTDATGSRRRNMRLGQTRAQKVADRLVEAGVPEGNIEVISKGQTEPAVRVDDPSIPALKNRRVEIFVTY